MLIIFKLIFYKHIKNEFMTLWHNKRNNNVIIVSTINSPFDLDNSIVR